MRLQPDTIKEMLVQSIIEDVDVKRKQGVGIKFMQFCTMWDLKKISDYPDEYATMLNGTYDDYLLEVHKELA